MENGVENIIWWKKVGGGSFHAKINGKGKLIKPNEKFRAKPSEIPKGFKDVVVPLEKIEEIPEQVLSAPKSLFKKVMRERKGWFDVVDSNGKRISDKALREDEADKLIEDLEK